MAATGRPSKLTAEVTEKIVEALAAGNYQDTACRYAGISPATFYRWMSEAEAADASETMREFRDAVEKAKARAEIRNVALIQTAANTGTWQAAAWWLERTNPNKWGRRTLIAGHDNGPVQVSVSPEDVDAKLMGMIAAYQASEAEREGSGTVSDVT